MKFIRQSIPDVVLVEPNVFGDDRGYFFESFRCDEFNKEVGFEVNFVQDNESKSSKGVLRGLHYQLPPHAQSKLVRVISGEILDVAVDIRKGSGTFGNHVKVKLSSENKRQLFVPRGFAHGFVVLSEEAIVSYKVDSYYAPDSDRGVAFNDPDLNIDWLLPEKELLLSEKDNKQPPLAEIDLKFAAGINYYAT